ncbi:MAG: hypothetical protein ACO2OQ_04045 [Thermofilaceae archaeon]
MEKVVVDTYALMAMVFGELIGRAGLTRAEVPPSRFIYQVGM